jgi:hypothetical protein
MVRETPDFVIADIFQPMITRTRVSSTSFMAQYSRGSMLKFAFDPSPVI